MADLYIYYKVRDENAARLEPLVRAMQERFRAQHGAVVQLKRRPETRDGMQTWMEVYPDAGEALLAGLSQAERDPALAALTEGPRRTEVFTDLTPCA